MTARDPTDHVAMIIKILGMPTRISGNLSSENKEEENGNSHVKPWKVKENASCSINKGAWFLFRHLGIHITRK